MNNLLYFWDDKMTRITIREKKVLVTQMLINNMYKSLKQMIIDLEKYKNEVLNAVLDAYFEKIRVNSGNLNLCLENYREVLAIMYESYEIDKQVNLM